VPNFANLKSQRESRNIPLIPSLKYHQGFKKATVTLSQANIRADLFAICLFKTARAIVEVNKIDTYFANYKEGSTFCLTQKHHIKIQHNAYEKKDPPFIFQKKI
jgi:hypothetical protein